MKANKLTMAVNWFFNGGYKTLAKNPNTSKQSQLSSAVVNLERASKVIGVEISDCIIFAYEHATKRK